MDTTFKDLSYNISCEHMKHLNNRYDNENNELYKRQFICEHDIDDEDDRYKKYINYLNGLYISKKSCIFKSTEPDKLEWTNSFKPLNSKMIFKNDIKERVIFNENTRRKIIKK